MAERDLNISSSDYPSNSHKSRERIKVEKVKLEGKVVKKKKGAGQKFVEEIIDENAKSVGAYIFSDVFIPAIKNLLSDAITNGINMLLYGDDSGSRRSSRDHGRSYVSYNRYYDEERREHNRRRLSSSQRAMHDFEDVIFDSRSDAEKVLDRLVDIVEEYGQVSVADFYDFVGIEASYTDRNWGWANLRSAYVERVRSGYIINFPRTEVLD